MNRYLYTFLVTIFSINLLGCSNNESSKESLSTPLEQYGNIGNSEVEQRARDFMLDGESKDIIPLEIIPFIPESYKVFNFVKGDLNGDGIEDYIVSLVNPKDFEAKFEEYSNSKLPTLFLLRNSDGLLQLKSKSNEFFGLENVENSILSSVEILIVEKGSGFTVSYRSQGASASGTWEEENLHFTYNKQIGDWVLDTVTVRIGVNSPSYQIEQLYIYKAEEIGDTAFLKYVEQNGFPYDDEVLERFIVKDSVYVNETYFTEEDNYKVYTKKHFGVVTLSKFKGMGELKGINW